MASGAPLRRTCRRMIASVFNRRSTAKERSLSEHGYCCKAKDLQVSYIPQGCSNQRSTYAEAACAPVQFASRNPRQEVDNNAHVTQHCTICSSWVTPHLCQHCALRLTLQASKSSLTAEVPRTPQCIRVRNCNSGLQTQDQGENY